MSASTSLTTKSVVVAPPKFAAGTVIVSPTLYPAPDPVDTTAVVKVLMLAFVNDKTASVPTGAN